MTNQDDIMQKMLEMMEKMEERNQILEKRSQQMEEKYEALLEKKNEKTPEKQVSLEELYDDNKKNILERRFYSLLFTKNQNKKRNRIGSVDKKRWSEYNTMAYFFTEETVIEAGNKIFGQRGYKDTRDVGKKFFFCEEDKMKEINLMMKEGGLGFIPGISGKKISPFTADTLKQNNGIMDLVNQATNVATSNKEKVLYTN